MNEIALIAEAIPTQYITDMAFEIRRVKLFGRLFVLGVGGSAANASHAVNDFRKIGGVEAYAPTDNVAELTAIANDVGWNMIFKHWLMESKLRPSDVVLVLSVNGGTDVYSQNLVEAIKYTKDQIGASVLAIVGRKDGYAALNAHHWVAVPCPNDEHRTPHAESFQSVICHLLAFMVRT